MATSDAPALTHHWRNFMLAERNLRGDAPHWRARFSRLAMLAAFATGQMGSGREASSQALLTAPGVDLQGANVYTFYVGRLQITALSDGTVPGDMHQLLRDTTDRRTDGLLQKGFVTNPVEISINVFMFKL